MNMRYSCLAIVFAGFALSGCGEQRGAGNDTVDAGSSAPAPQDLIVLDDDLERLKEDFNANIGRVRLVFLSGPTCGICLRGMADLNDEFVAASQGDDRLVTFVVHVPTMGAKQQHAADSMPLLDGPRVHHYWEQTGIIGQLYRKVMNVDVYVWDFWTVYGPDAVWRDTLPPAPDYFEHQLGGGGLRGFPKELVLDAERFAAKAREYLETAESGGIAGNAEKEIPGQHRLADGTVIPHVGQPRNVAVRQHIMGRGGYRDLKRIREIEARGNIDADGTAAPLTVRYERPNTIHRTVGGGDSASTAVSSQHGSAKIPQRGFRGLPFEYEALLVETFEFDGLLVDWPDKGHELEMLGMRKFGDVLAWQLELAQNGGKRWHLYLDSHTGDLVRASLLGPDGAPQLIIDQRNFEPVSGFTFPHRRVYRDPNGNVLAVESFESIKVELEPAELEQAAVSD